MDGNARTERTAGSGGRGHEREFVALRATAGSERGASGADRRARPASPAVRIADDLSKAASGRRDHQP